MIVQPRKLGRQRLHEDLGRISFARITRISVPKDKYDDHGNIKYYIGEAEEVFVHEALEEEKRRRGKKPSQKRGKGPRRRPRIFFLSSNHRARGLGLMVGPAALMDAYSIDDFSAHCVPPPPQLGTIIAGVLIDSRNPKGRCKQMFTQWASHANPLLMLAHITENGSRVSKDDMRVSLQQRKLEAKDDFWVLARIIVFNDFALIRKMLEAAESVSDVRIHIDIAAFVMIASRNFDETLLEDFRNLQRKLAPADPVLAAHSQPMFGMMPTVPAPTRTQSTVASWDPAQFGKAPAPAYAEGASGEGRHNPWASGGASRNPDPWKAYSPSRVQPVTQPVMHDPTNPYAQTPLSPYADGK